MFYLYEQYFRNSKIILVAIVPTRKSLFSLFPLRMATLRNKYPIIILKDAYLVRYNPKIIFSRFYPIDMENFKDFIFTL